MIEARISGIYEIRNKVNGHVYIGSSVNIRRRWQDHVIKLNKGIHHSAYLQAAWDKYGSRNFQFDILQYSNKENLLLDEQKFLDEWKPEYNIAVDAFAPTRGRNMGEDFGDKISKRMIGNKYTLGRKRPKEECDAISKAHKGRKPHKNTIQALNDRAKDWGDWISPSGTIIHITNLSVFCIENHLSQGNMWGVFNGTRKQHKGWKVYNGN